MHKGLPGVKDHLDLILHLLSHMLHSTDQRDGHT